MAFSDTEYPEPTKSPGSRAWFEGMVSFVLHRPDGHIALVTGDRRNRNYQVSKRFVPGEQRGTGVITVAAGESHGSDF